jgi:hypothetical protein
MNLNELQTLLTPYVVSTILWLVDAWSYTKVYSRYYAYCALLWCVRIASALSGRFITGPVVVYAKAEMQDPRFPINCAVEHTPLVINLTVPVAVFFATQKVQTCNRLQKFIGDFGVNVDEVYISLLDNGKFYNIVLDLVNENESLTNTDIDYGEIILTNFIKDDHKLHK